MTAPTSNDHLLTIARHIAQMLPRIEPPDQNGFLMGVGLVAVFATKKGDDDYGIATDWVWGLAPDLPQSLMDEVRKQAAETADKPMKAVR